ncbi:unnamed protein product [Oppiella nova]|uniref:Uncharacterized protein n=1 Tax=Oppiella nova TaxID=334625 RepID=A0A7R9LPQ2_9ACAR|nr:unnamed protein product [Oppiella nova]CAG2165711.1 unnamed protein product [Oppiella nova]
MKWKLIGVFISNALNICAICCWPFAPPPPPPLPPLHLFEDHYVRVSHGPHFDRGLTHMARVNSPRVVCEVLGYLPVVELPYKDGYSGRYRMRLGVLSHKLLCYDLGTTQEFSQYIPNDKPMMKVRHMNYRYRKRLKSQRPIESNGNSVTHPRKDIKWSQETSAGHNGQQPRRYNVIDNRYHNKQNIPNSVNDKLPRIPGKVVHEGESLNRQNYSQNKSIEANDNNISSDKTVKDLYENSSQTREKTNSIRHNVPNIPIEITSYDTKSPDGVVTQVTEMLYDIENNPFKGPTTTPIISPFLPPAATPPLIPVTSNPRLNNQIPYHMNSGYSEIRETSSSQPIQPINTAVTARFNGMTMTPSMSWTSQKNTLDPVPIVWTNEPTAPPPTPRPIPSSSSSEYHTRRARKRTTTQKPQTTVKSSAREGQPGLSSAAIAGIVIGSMVSIVLLAGTSLFVMYRNPFRRTLGPLSSSGSPPPPVPPPTLPPNDSNTIPSRVSPSVAPQKTQEIIE